MGLQDINSTFKALGDPTRRHILALLKKRNLTAGQLATHFPISKPSLSHHLNVLKNANLINQERRGQEIIYSLNMTVFYELSTELINTFNLGEKK